MSTIAFDINGTWTLDPDLFLEVAYGFYDKGWRVVIVTGAPQPSDKIIRLHLESWQIVTAIEGEFKKDAAIRAGYQVDIWVDDMPGFIEPCRILKPATDDEL